MTMKLRIDPLRCHNTEYCVRQAPQLFAAAERGGPTTVRIERLPPELVALARETEALCPTGAIAVDDDPA